MVREDSQIDFFLEKRPLDASLRPPSDTWKSLKIDFSPIEIENSSFDMLSVAEVTTTNRVRENGPILDSRPAKTCHTRTAAPTKFQLYLPGEGYFWQRLEVSRKKRTVAQCKGIF